MESKSPARALKPRDVAIHQFGSGSTKIVQRFLLSNIARRSPIRRAWLRDANHLGTAESLGIERGTVPTAPSPTASNDYGNGSTAYTCRSRMSVTSSGERRALNPLDA